MKNDVCNLQGNNIQEKVKREWEKSHFPNFTRVAVPCGDTPSGSRWDKKNPGRLLEPGFFPY